MGGIVEAVGNIFSPPKKPSMPAPAPMPEPEKVPDTSMQDPIAKQVREDEAKKLKAKKGSAATVLTSPLGLAGTESGSGNLGNTLLGRVGK